MYRVFIKEFSSSYLFGEDSESCPNLGHLRSIGNYS